MTKKRPAFDLWQLFKDGRSGGVAFGETDVAGLRKALGARNHGCEGQLPFSPWVLTAEQAECYFQGLPPRLWSVKIHPSSWSLSGEAAELLDGEEPSEECAGMARIALDGRPLSQFSTIRRLFQNCPDASKLTVRCNDEKLLEFFVVEGGRSITFGYRVEMRKLSYPLSIFDFDYFLYAVWIFDNGADAALSKTLPEGTETRADVFSRIANTRPQKATSPDKLNN